MPDLNHPQSNAPEPNSLVSGFHFRGQLPHLKKEGATYFVTFRQSDSLPAHQIARLKSERKRLLEQACAAKSPLTWHEEQSLLAWYCDRVEALLDAGQGSCWLSKPEIAELITGALNFFDQERYVLQAFVVMPNHVHVIVRPMAGYTLSEILHSWKSYTGKEVKKIMRCSSKTFWQKESFDHWVRDDSEHTRLVAYIEDNPIKARLCERPEDWKWSSANEQYRQSRSGRRPRLP